MFLTWITEIVLILAGIFIALAVGGMLYQAISARLDKKRYPPLGEMIDVGGYRLHIHCTGTGSPTVLLDCGMRSNSLEWALVQPEIAKFTRVCSYDRAGSGWSEKSPFARTSKNIVAELRTALKKANISGPYIVVGHSFGGLNAHLFAKMYPEEVVGVILVDSASENYDKLLKPKFALRAMKLSMLFGWTRLFSSRESLKSFLPSIQDQFLTLELTTQSLNTTIEEFMLFDQSAKQLRQLGSHLGDIPLTVITASIRKFWKGAGFTKEECDRMFIQFEAFQKEILTRSNRSKQVFATKSDHMIPRNQPEIIVAAVREQVDAIR